MKTLYSKYHLQSDNPYLENYIKSNLYIKKKQYYEVIYNLLKNIDTNDKDLEKIHEDLIYVYEKMKKLYELNLNGIKIDLIGGSVRDLLLNKKIKDLDILLSFENLEENINTLINFKTKDFFNEEEVNTYTTLAKKLDKLEKEKEEIEKTKNLNQNKDIYI